MTAPTDSVSPERLSMTSLVLPGNSYPVFTIHTKDVFRPQERDETFIARTSDRNLFKRCRRLWQWMGVNGQGRRMKQEADYFWFGTGVHFALEDFHGVNYYGHPAIAFRAYAMATLANGKIPPNWKELELIGMGVMSYYAELYLANRDPLQTYVVDGIPQCEVNARIDLGVQDSSGRQLLYGFTLDRVAIDEYDRLWIVEYKTAKVFRTEHYETDDQITAYCWAAWKYYGKPVAGVVYQQHKKTLPVLPKILATGRISHDKRQQTTAVLYSRMLIDFYGSISAAPNQNVLMYNALVAAEDEDSDKFVHRQKVERNMTQLQSFEAKLMMELEDMTNPRLPMYPNPTKDCAWGCPLQAACVAMDDGGDWEQLLDAYTFNAQTVAEEQSKWRHHLPQLASCNLPLESVQYNNLVRQLALLVPESPPGLSQEESDHQQPSPTESFLQELGML